MEQLKICMLGEFSLTAAGKRISSGDNRSRKVWALIAYLIHNRQRQVGAEELIRVIWAGEMASDNPENTLKVTVHRARTTLDSLWQGAGHDLIRYRNDGYTWNLRVPAELDTERFEQLCDGDEARKKEAVDLYRGSYLGSLAAGDWTIPVAMHYHECYLRALMGLLPQLESAGAHWEIADICHRAVPLDPYHEGIRAYLMRALMALDDCPGAVEVYENLRKRLQHDFGVAPGEELQALYSRLADTDYDSGFPADTVLSRLLEQDPGEGALMCNFDAFRVVCQAEARAMLRSGNTSHVALLSVSGAREKNLTPRKRERAMDELGELVRLNLRRGDVIAKCSDAQFVILLPQANYANSCVVCRRLISAFESRYPTSPARVHYLVQPLQAPASGKER